MMTTIVILCILGLLLYCIYLFIKYWIKVIKNEIKWRKMIDYFKPENYG